jgi:metal-dependent amidase/aminoacylase/carboxypeptidase family protein
MSANYASAITARQYYAIHGQGGHWENPHPAFEHIVTASKPSTGLPDISGLTAGEQAAINQWVATADNGEPTIPPGITLAGTAFSGTANTKVSDYLTYFATAAYKAWRVANILDRHSQWRWLCADGHDRAEVAVPPSTSSSGSGSGGGSGPITKTNN